MNIKNIIMWVIIVFLTIGLYNMFKNPQSNLKSNKKHDGQTIWIEFIKHSISLLKNNGYLNMIIPSIWLKPDKEKMYYFLLKYNIQYLNCFSNTKSNQIISHRINNYRNRCRVN